MSDKHLRAVGKRTPRQCSLCERVRTVTFGTENKGTPRFGFNPTFLTSQAGYTELIHKLGGKGMDGLYATMTVQVPYLDDASPPVRFWANKYKTKYGDDPALFSVIGYQIVDYFAQAAAKAGKNLTTDTFIKAMDTMSFPADIFGAPPMTYSPTKRLGSEASRLSQIVDGRWKVVVDYGTR